MTRMKDTKSILLAGVGGQGIILMSKAFTAGLVAAGYDVKMSEVHGMAQRGGSVSTQVRYGEKVFSPIIGRGEADVLVAFEKMEAVRYAEFLKPSGSAVVNDAEIVPLPVASGAVAYPGGVLDAMQKAFRVRVVPASGLAEKLGSIRCMNIVLLGALVNALGLDKIDWKAALTETLPPKILKLNLDAFEAGFHYGG